jgi:hypothetical protein
LEHVQPKLLLLLLLRAPAGCGKGYQWPDQGLGWDVAALSDAHPEYKGSCGACYEIKCDSSSVRDGYGEGALLLAAGCIECQDAQSVRARS